MEHINPNFVPLNVRLGRNEIAAGLQKTYTMPENGWRCSICFDMLVPNQPIMLHSCGKHWFHSVCLSRTENSRCPLCREEGYCGFENDRNKRLHPKLTTVSSANNELCSACHQVIEGGKVHVLLSKCNHRLHNDCALHGMITNGVTVLGDPYCRTCLH